MSELLSRREFFGAIAGLSLSKEADKDREQDKRLGGLESGLTYLGQVVDYNGSVLNHNQEITDARIGILENKVFPKIDLEKELKG